MAKLSDLEEKVVSSARRLAISLLGSRHELTRKISDRLAEIYIARECFGFAEDLYKESLAIYVERYGCDHRALVPSLLKLANVLCLQHRYEEANCMYRRIEILSMKLQSQHV